MLRHIATLVLLCSCWFLWSGHTEPLILGFGLGSCLLVTWIAARMDRVDGSREAYLLGLRWLPYVPWLLWEILKSNLHVIRVILSPRLPVAPRLIVVESTQRSDLGWVVFANSITLTPGTLTLDLRDGRVLVHALTAETAEGLQTGEMDRKVTALEGSR